jgi:hypothetical protein
MDFYKAINQAADHIERYPSSYRFTQGIVPGPQHDAGKGPGGCEACMLAHIGRFAGMSAYTSHVIVADCMGIAESEFYARIYDLLPPQAKTIGHIYEGSNVPYIAAAMREYAERYHKRSERPAIPDEVRAIFESKGASSRRPSSGLSWINIPSTHRHEIATDRYVPIT